MDQEPFFTDTVGVIAGAVKQIDYIAESTELVERKGRE